MESFKKHKKIFVSILSISFIFLVVGIFLFVSKPNIITLIPPSIAEATSLDINNKLNSGFPVKLKIPKINVNATVEYLGLTPDGAMDSPKGPAPAGWYNLGPKPGEIGSSVIDGHSGWKGGIPAVFDNLNKLKIGDKVYVLNDMGVITTFVVRKVEVYSPNADASDVFASNDGKSHLNLITCTGFWNKILKSHSSRLVVFTDKE